MSDEANKDGIAWLVNFRATIEKERRDQDKWWSEWGFLAKSAADGVLPNNRSEFISALEAKYAALAEGQPVPGFSTESSRWGRNKPLDFGSKHAKRKMAFITPTDPY